MPDHLAVDNIVSPKRQAIIDAATELFMSHGFKDVSMDAIATKADVSKRTVYSHFENKDQLFEGIMSEACACQSFANFFEDDEGASLPIREFLTAYGLDFLEAINRTETIALYRAIVCQAANFPDIGRKFFEYGPALTAARLAEYLNDRVSEGKLNIEDTYAASGQFHAMIGVNMVMELSTGARAPYSQQEMDERVSGVVDMFLRAYGT